MSKIKRLKVKEETAFSDFIDIGADAINIDMADGTNLEDTIAEIKAGGGGGTAGAAIEKADSKEDAIAKSQENPNILYYWTAPIEGITSITLTPNGRGHSTNGNPWTDNIISSECRHFLKVDIIPEGEYKAEDFSIEISGSSDQLTVSLENQEVGFWAIIDVKGSNWDKETVTVKSNNYNIEGTYEIVAYKDGNWDNIAPD